MCLVCEKKSDAFICVECDNEYAEWLIEMGYKVGEFDDNRSPKFIPNPHAGTKWAVLD